MKSKDKNSKPKGGTQDDLLIGGPQNDLLVGGKGNDQIFGGAGNDLLLGDNFGGWAFGASGKRNDYSDYLDGGAGNDFVFGGRGNDTLNYTMAENLGAGFADIGTRDYYDGGSGYDVLKLTLTYGEFRLDSVQRDMADFRAFLSTSANERSPHNPTFHFSSFDLDARNFESLAINLVNTGPAALSDAGTTNEDTPLAVNAATGLLANDSDADHLDVLRVTASDAASALGATVTVNPDGSYLYDPSAVLQLQQLKPGQTASDSFGYTVADLAGASARATVTVTVAGVNDAPVARADAYATAEDDVLAIGTSGVLTNDTDIEGDALHALLVSGPAHGTLTLNDDGSFSYAPDTDFNGGDSFSYRANDGDLDSAIVQVGIVVSEVNDAPTAADDAATVAEDSSGSVINVLGNDSAGPANEAGQMLTITAASALHGNVSIAANGSLLYTPDANFFGADTISYTVTDDGTTAGAPDPRSAAGSVAVMVAEVNDTPTATGDSATVAEDSAANPIDVLGNDSAGPANEAAQTLTVTAASALHGSVSIAVDGSLLYTPDTNFFGADTISYTVTDDGTTAGAPDPRSMAGSVAVTVTPVNDAPLAAADAYEVAEDGILTVPASGILSNDSDVDGDALHALLVSGPAHGSLTLNDDGSFSYAPNADFNGSDSFSYRANDGALDSTLSTVALTVTPVNDAPDAANDSASTNEDTVITGNVLNGDNGGKDTDIDGDTLSVTTTGAFASALGASVTLLEDGTFSYDPSGSTTLQALAAGSSATDTFQYTIDDGNGGSDSATVSIGVAGLSEAASSGSSKIAPSVFDSSNLDYYIRFEGVGDSEWLNLHGFSLGFENSGSPLGGAGGTGRVAADDVLSALGSNATGTALAGMLASGSHIKNVDIEVYQRNSEGTRVLLDDYKFTDVVVTNLDTAGNSYSIGNDVSFDFTQFSHGHVTRDAKGSVTNDSVGWDFEANEAYTGSTPHADATSKVVTQDEVFNTTLDYYLRFDGSDGWLRLDSFVMGLNGGTGAIGGGSSSRATADPVSVGLGSSAALLDLSGFLFAGTEIKNVEIEVYRPGSKSDMLVDEFLFDQVLVTGLNSSNAVDNVLSFDFARFSHGHVDYTETGAKGDVTIAGWDFETNQKYAGPAPAAQAAKDLPVSSVFDSSDLDYYIRFEGVGDSEWLNLHGFSLGFENSGSPLGGAGGTGRVAADDVLSALGSNATGTALAGMLASGSHIKNVDIEVYQRNSEGTRVLLDDYKFTDVVVTNLDTAGNSYSIGNDVSFDFTQFSHGHVTRDAKGSVTNDSVGWDFEANEAYTGSTPHADATSKVVTQDEVFNTTLDYYLRFDGSDGWLRLDSFVMGLNGGTGAIGGGSSSRATADPVSVGLGSSAALLDLSGFLFTGAEIKNVEIEVYRPGSKSDMLVDEFLFDQVLVTGLNSSNAVDNVLSFDFARFSHGHVNYTETGAKGDVTIAGWDFETNQKYAGPAPAAQAAKDLPVSSVFDSSDLDYYIRFEGVGDSEWLNLHGFSLGFENSGSPLGGAGGTGRVAADDVLSALGSNATGTALAGMLASGSHIKNVDIEVYQRNSEGTRVLLDDYKFTDVVVTNLDTAGNSYSIGNDVSFDFTQFSHGHVTRDAKGSVTNDSVGWDFEANEAYTGSTPHADATSKVVTQDEVFNTTLDYYLRFDGSDGWLRLDSFVMGLNGGTGAIGGGSSSRATADPVSVGLGSSAALLDLSGFLFAGTEIKNVEIEVYRPGSKSDMLVDEFLFDQVLVTGLNSSNAVDNVLSFDFARFSHGHVDYTETGAKGDVTLAGWDFETNKAYSGPTPHADVNFF